MPESILEYLLTTAIGSLIAALSWLWKKVIMLDRETALLIQLMEEREKRRLEAEERRDIQRKEILDAVHELRSEVIKIARHE